VAKAVKMRESHDQKSVGVPRTLIRDMIRRFLDGSVDIQAHAIGDILYAPLLMPWKLTSLR
jgi:hypothetical protein